MHKKNLNTTTSFKEIRKQPCWFLCLCLINVSGTSPSKSEIFAKNVIAVVDHDQLIPHLHSNESTIHGEQHPTFRFVVLQLQFHPIHTNVLQTWFFGTSNLSSFEH